MPGKFIAVICDAEHSQVCSINDFLDQNLRTEEIIHVRHAQATESWSVESKYADSISGEDIAMFLKERLDVASFAVFDFDMYVRKGGQIFQGKTTSNGSIHWCGGAGNSGS